MDTICLKYQIMLLETICMKYQILFSRQKKIEIYLQVTEGGSAAEWVCSYGFDVVVAQINIPKPVTVSKGREVCQQVVWDRYVVETGQVVQYSIVYSLKQIISQIPRKSINSDT